MKRKINLFPASIAGRYILYPFEPVHKKFSCFSFYRTQLGNLWWSVLELLVRYIPAGSSRAENVDPAGAVLGIVILWTDGKYKFSQAILRIDIPWTVSKYRSS
jgi:hypothetical protein